MPLLVFLTTLALSVRWIAWLFRERILETGLCLVNDFGEPNVEVIDKVGALVGGLTCGARKDVGADLLAKAELED